MIDSHCHLDYCADPLAAADPTLFALVSIGTTVARSETTLALAEKLPNVYAAVGIHPTEAENALDETVRSRIETLAQHPKVVAIGESGFDYYWDSASPEAQRSSILWQAELAQRLNKPLILHVRDKDGKEEASLETARTIREVGLTKGILHCFNGHEALLKTGLEQGLMISFAGNLTYKNAKVLHEVAKRVPLEHLLVETDSPYLTPVPKRGERNVPANVRYTARFLAELRGIAFEELEIILDANARRVFSL